MVIQLIKLIEYNMNLGYSRTGISRIHIIAIYRKFIRFTPGLIKSIGENKFSFVISKILFYNFQNFLL